MVVHLDSENAELLPVDDAAFVVDVIVDDGVTRLPPDFVSLGLIVRVQATIKGRLNHEKRIVTSLNGLRTCCKLNTGMAFAALLLARGRSDPRLIKFETPRPGCTGPPTVGRAVVYTASMRSSTEYIRESHMPKRSENELTTTLSPIRIPCDLLAAVRHKAQREDETLSQVVRRALKAYVTGVTQGDFFDPPTKRRSRKSK